VKGLLPRLSDTKPSFMKHCLFGTVSLRFVACAPADRIAGQA